MNYALAGHPATDITWKLTGNFGGEDYPDKARGPLNEGGLYGERQGYHLPSPPSANWSSGSPLQGLSAPGISFYTTSFNLSMPAGYDIPLSFAFTNATAADFRSQLYVNGYQFGKYVNNIGPQEVYPVPQGILNYNGPNYIALSLWAQEANGTTFGGLALQDDIVIQSGYGFPVALSPMPAYTPRPGAY